MADGDNSGSVVVVIFLLAVIILLGAFIFWFILRRSQPIGGACSGTNECDPGLICSSGMCSVPLGSQCTTINDCESSAQECRSLKAGLPPTCNYATGSLGDACGNSVGNMSCVSAFVCDDTASSSVSKQPTFTCVIPDCKTGCEGNNNWCLVTSTCSAAGQCVPVSGGCPVTTPLAMPIPVMASPIPSFTTTASTPISPSFLEENKSKNQRLPVNDRIIYDNQYLDATNEGLKVGGVIKSQQVYTQLVTFDGYLYGLSHGEIYRIDYGSFRETPISLTLRNIVHVSSTLDDNAVWVQSEREGVLYTNKSGWKKGSKERISSGKIRVYGGNADLYHELNRGESVAVDWKGGLVYPEGNERVRIVGNQILYY